ncbi:Ig-like domain-containing protein [Hafnia paralvei]|uniref:Ig-like domain-containing protein n=1 Tax=Hafnia paralvei TaxID=546367 RepID=UPI003C2ABFC6
MFRFFAWLQILLQILFPLVSMVSHSALAQSSSSSNTNLSPFAVDRNVSSTTKDTTALPYGDTMSSLASSLSSNGAEGVASSAKSAATGYASSSAQQWLSQFGTARVQLNVDDNGNWDDSAIDFLAPLYDNKKSMLFTQLGLRAPDGRVTGNMGMGVRTFYVEDWMFGGNVFFDDDFTGKNRRIGMGAEAWTNNLKLSANTYVGTTEWHQSRDFNDYNEKPADGYDVRAEGYLPAYPQLGAKLMYEQYYGDKVALFDTDHLQSNPSAVTTGLSYTPIPLVQLAVNYKRGQDSLDDTQFQVNFRYDLGRPWAYQVDPESVRLERSLAGSRYDLVERNNQIVLQYKKKDQQNVSNLNLQVTVDNSPSDGLTPNSAQVYATDKDGQPVRNAPIVWSTTGSAKFATPNTVTNDSGISTVNFTNTLPEAVQITAKSGAASASQNSQFNAVTVSNITLKITKDGSIADGKTPNHAVATVTDINNRPIANTQVKWGVDAPATLKSTQTTTNASGQVTADFTSTTAGAVMLTTTAGDKSASQQGHFTANSANNIIDTMVVTQDGSPANGTTPNSVTVTVKDGNGAPVSNANVSLSADKSTVAFGSALKAKTAKASKSFQTDTRGSLTVSFTDTVAESVQLTATLDNANSKTAAAKFIADNSSAKVNNLIISKDGSVANGTATNQATVTVTDVNNNPLSDVNVTWSQDGTAILGNSAKTDASGKTTVTFTDTKAETVNITATVNASSLSKPSTFVADAATAHVSTLTIDTDGSAANGTAQNSATATVVDSGNNILANTTVNWTVTGSAGLTSGTSTTNSSGQAVMTFTDTKAETVTLTAKAGSSDTGQSKPSTFVADAATAHVSTLTIDTDGSAANGTAQNSATATVVDSGNNILANTTVNWTVTGSAGLTSGTSTTNSSGQAVMTFTDTKAETVTLTAKAGSSDTGQSKPSTFVADAATAHVSTLTIDTDGSAANGTAQNSATATVVDSGNNILANTTVNWIVTGSAGLTSGTSTTNSSGQAVMTFTDTKAETVTLTAKAGSSDTGQSKPSTFVADAATAHVSTLTIDTDGSAANGTAQNSATATVVDSGNNILANTTVNWIVTGSAGLTSGTSTTNSSGQAVMTFTDTKAETVTLTAKAGSSDTGQSKPSTFVADAATAHVSTLTIDTDGSAANGTAQNSATATVVDSGNNILANTTVNWTVTGSAGLTSGTSTTNSSGQAVMTFTDTKAETVTLTAKAGSSDTGQSKPSTFVADAATAHVSTLTIDTDDSAANGTAQNSATATVVDSGNNILANTTVNWTVTGSAGLTSGTSTTNGSGQAVMTFTDTKAETVTLTAKAGSSDTGQSKPSTFVADAATAHVSMLTIDTDGSPADGTSQNKATVTVVDANNNPLPGQDVTWSQDGSAVMGTSAKTDNNGQTIVTFTDVNAETVNITATVNGSSQSKPSTFIARIVATIVVTVVTDNQSSINGTDVVKAAAYDADGEPVPNVPIKWDDKNTNQLSITPPSSYTDINGEVTANVRPKLSAGRFIIEASTVITGGTTIIGSNVVSFQ